MSTVTALFDAAPVMLQDGRVSGPPGMIELLDLLAERTGRAPVTPEGPNLRLIGWRDDPWAFVALAREMQPSVTFRTDGMPGLDLGSEGGE